MAQHNTINVKLSNPQINKLKSAMKNGTKATSNLSSNVARDFNEENNFPHKLLLPTTQVSKFRKDFANDSSANIRLSKTHLDKIIQSGWFLGRR